MVHGARGTLRLGGYRISASGRKGRHQSTSRWRSLTHSCARQVLSGVHPPYWPNGKEVCERPARTAGTAPFLGPAANVVAIRVCSSRLPITDRHPLVPVISRPYVRCHVRTSFRAAVAHSSCGVFWRRRWLTRHRARAHQSSLGAPGTAPATHAGPWTPCSSRVAQRRYVTARA